MFINNKVAIIGGGASGLMAAIACKESLGKSVDVVVYEQYDKLGKKLLATGNGRCNLSNADISDECYNNAFPGEVFKQFSPAQTIEFFNRIGLEIYADEEGRFYPITEQALSVRDCLSNYAKRLGVLFKTSRRIDKIATYNGRYIIDNEIYLGVILAVGSNAGFKSADVPRFTELGLEYTSEMPALVPIKTQRAPIRFLDGVRSKCELTLYSGENQSVKLRGEILFREYGISGIVVFCISKYIAEDMRKGERQFIIGIDLFPQVSAEELLVLLRARFNRYNACNVSEYFVGLLNDKLAKNILYRLGIAENEQVGLLNEKLEVVVELLKDTRVECEGLCDFENAQTVCGGVSLSSVKNTLESVKSKNLFLCGEMLDVNGTCGGYNLQFAWSSGIVAGKNLAKNLRGGQ